MIGSTPLIIQLWKDNTMAPNDEAISRKHILVEDDRTGTSLETLRRTVLDNLFYIQGKFPAIATPLWLLHGPGLHRAGSTVAPLAQIGWNLVV